MSVLVQTIETTETMAQLYAEEHPHLPSALDTLTLKELLSWLNHKDTKNAICSLISRLRKTDKPQSCKRGRRNSSAKTGSTPRSDEDDEKCEVLNLVENKAIFSPQ